MKNFTSKIIALLALISCRQGEIKSQQILGADSKAGLVLSLNTALGSHFQRLGFNMHLYYVNQHFQSNTSLRFYYNFKNIGPKFKYPEFVLSQGVVLAYGKMDHPLNPFLSSVSNQSNYRNSVAYSYNFWLNPIKTSQQTGVIAIQFNGLSCIVENDILARPTFDRFRSGAFLIQYQDGNFQAAINCSLWTGKFGKKRAVETAKGFCGNCYMDTVGGVYTKYSNGLLSAQVKYFIGSAQNLQGNLGLDAEQVRNAVQNRFVHQVKPVPDNWVKTKNCYMPMVDENGDQFLFEEGQKIRKARIYWNLFTNANHFY